MKTALRILIVDDEISIRNLLKMNLVNAQYEVNEAVSGIEALEKAASFHPHLIILDLGLPDMNGLEVLKKLRVWTTVPVIILTVSDDVPTKVTLLDAGADDYLTKPFGPEELLARVRVALRHKEMVEATPIFESGNLRVDLNKRIAYVSEVQIKLTNTEYEVLSRLVRDHGKVVTQSQILKQVWGAVAKDQGHYLRIYIKQLRKKIESNPSEPVHILTEPGIGYRLV